MLHWPLAGGTTDAQVQSSILTAAAGESYGGPHLQVVSLITIEVHARDMIEKLGKANCSSPTDFEWVSQLRFYWDKELNDCIVKQVGS